MIYNKLKIYRIKPIPLSLHVDSWDIKSAYFYSRKADGAYAFQFLEISIEQKREEYSYTVYPKIIKESGIYYINAYSESYIDIKTRQKINPNIYDANLLTRMEINGWKNIVRSIECDTKKTWYQPFFENDVILNDKEMNYGKG